MLRKQNSIPEILHTAPNSKFKLNLILLLKSLPDSRQRRIKMGIS